MSESYRPKQSGRRKLHKHEFILEPKQDLRQYNKLRKLWNKKLADSGFKDIEYITNLGTTSPYTTDYALARIRQEYSPEAEEYWRRCTLFALHFNFNSLKKSIAPAMARWLWTKWSEGIGYTELSRLIKQPNKPRVRYYRGAKLPPASVFWIHTKFRLVLIPAFEAWCKQEVNGLLVVDHDLTSP